MNEVFWFVAGVLAGLALAFVAIPLRRLAAALFTLRNALFAIVALAAFVGLALLLYKTTGGRPDLATSRAASTDASSQQPEKADLKQADSMEVSIKRLEARLARDGGSGDDWELLARSYEFVGRPKDAELAHKHFLPRAAGTSAAAITGTVSIDRTLLGRVKPGDTLFVYAKTTDLAGPPLAVQRSTIDRWPAAFQLDDSLAMMPTRKLSDFDKVIVEARISRSGQAGRATGDLYGVSPVISASQGQPLAIVISQEVK